MFLEFAMALRPIQRCAGLRPPNILLTFALRRFAWQGQGLRRSGGRRPERRHRAKMVVVETSSEEVAVTVHSIVDRADRR
jgi:hypothetical protein